MANTVPLIVYGDRPSKGVTFPPVVVLSSQQPIPLMKTALTSLLTALLLGVAAFASGRPFDAADLTAIAFATGLVAWTIDQYSREPRMLTLGRPVHLPVPTGTRRSASPAVKIAA